MAEDLRARLVGHAKAFEGVMALMPADQYYGKDNSNQWQRKKQTKEERRAAKKAKLDPENYKSALDVHTENERKRKRELEDPDAAGTTQDSEQASEQLKRADKQAKKQKLDEGESKATSKSKAKKEHTAEEDEAIRREKAEKRRLKRERKKDRNSSKRERIEARKQEKQKSVANKPTTEKSHTASKETSKPKKLKVVVTEAGDSSDDDAGVEDDEAVAGLVDDEAEVDSEDEVEDDDEDVEESTGFALDGFNEHDTVQSDGDSVSSDASSDPDTPTFDISGQLSSASSSSSIVPPSESDLDTPKARSKLLNSARVHSQPTASQVETSHATQSGLSVPQQPLPEINMDPAQTKSSSDKPAKFPKLTEVDSEKLKERLESRLAALRAARKADGPDGKPAKNRQDMIDARRQKQDRRKQHKKELRQKARQEQTAEEEAARLRGGSGSPMWSPNALLAPREPANNFSFGKVAFADGQEVDTGSGVANDGKKKGPQDVKTALEAAKKKKDRLSGLDQDKRDNIAEKDRWLNAKKRIQGEKIRDDTSLLKKTLKRQDKGKAKSEKEWNDRIEGVQAGKAMKQKKRDENLRKRKDEKGTKKGKGKPAPKPKKRPGFEGSYKIGTKGGQGP